MEKIPYDRLLKIAEKMHLWIFMNCCNEQEEYEKIGLTPEENAILGYGGMYEIALDDKGHNANK